MSVRFFVTSSALMILSWLAVTFFLVVPMETYRTPAVASGGLQNGGESPVVAVVAAEEPVAVKVAH